MTDTNTEETVPYGFYRSVAQPGTLFKCRWATTTRKQEDVETPRPPLKSFTTDETWTPSTYRKALAAWRDNAPKTDGPIMPREAVTTKPRHDKLSVKLKSLMAWKHATEPDDPMATGWLRYDLHADNDNNFDEHDEPVPQLLDTVEEIRPSIPEMQREWPSSVKNKWPVVYLHDVAIGGDMAHGTQKGVPEYAASEIAGGNAPKRDRRIVKRIRGLEFSNGEQVVRTEVRGPNDTVVMGDVRMPAGALVRYKAGKSGKWYRPSDEFRGAKGGLPETEPTVGMGGHSQGSLPCPDPVVDHEWAQTIRKLVDKETACVLDLALDAANFKEIGEHFGKQGKNAERVGKQMVIDACGKLDLILAANDNGYKVTRREDIAA